MPKYSNNTVVPSTETIISDRSFGGERPLFRASNLSLENVEIASGESALKHAQNVVARHCSFQGKYPFWHGKHIRVAACTFRPGSRAAIWYSEQVEMRDAQIEAPKMFRHVRRLAIENCQFTDAEETLWFCSDVSVHDTTFRQADYLFMQGHDMQVENMTLLGNYVFQGAKNVVIRQARIEAKDAFWDSENVTVYDSVLNGEYLGWHTKNLRLINCTITGTQPLCFATNLQMEHCTMIDTDLCFEYSTLEADIVGDIESVKNPQGGSIQARRIGYIFLDENCRNPGACNIQTSEEVEI